MERALLARPKAVGTVERALLARPKAVGTVAQNPSTSRNGRKRAQGSQRIAANNFTFAFFCGHSIYVFALRLGASPASLREALRAGSLRGIFLLQCAARLRTNATKPWICSWVRSGFGGIAPVLPIATPPSLITIRIRSSEFDFCQFGSVRSCGFSASPVAEGPSPFPSRP